MTLGFGIASAGAALSALNASGSDVGRTQQRNQLRITAASYGEQAGARRWGGDGGEPHTVKPWCEALV
jgi:hypothetical protein